MTTIVMESDLLFVSLDPFFFFFLLAMITLSPFPSNALIGIL